ncbi:MAG: YidC/Oxa1 family membrane protein insertase, partial [Elusimicrobia bacterium]|nr:YidC/Oxa1 family membrane protein insertase [Elusimicrobiota bacterium]
MSDILYYIIIYPLQLIIEILFNALYNSEVSIGLTIFSVSLFVNLGSLPMFLSAYKLQKKEKDIQEKMAPKVKSIKANFKGAEKFMMLSTYYKQNKYHPIMSLRISLSLLLEIPFFIAAYLFFSQLDIVNGMSCWFIKDLSLPDKLLTINGLTINILPILMTIFNIISGEIYLKGCKFKEKLQMYVLAIIFLVILYNSPSGLVLYWTFNNLISLVRNLVIKSKKIKFLSFALIFVFAFCLLYKVVINMSQPFMAVGLFCLIFVIPFYVCIKDININKIVEQKSKKSEIGLFVLSVVNIFVLVSLLIPTTIIASDVTAFYNKNYSYFILLFYISIKFFGIFIFWPVITYCFLSKNLKKFLLYFSVNINFIFIVSMFSFFSENLRFYLIYNIFYYILVVSIISFLLYKKYFSILIKIMTIIILTIVILSISNIYKINKSFSNRINSVQKNETKKIHLSKTDKNILV